MQPVIVVPDGLSAAGRPLRAIPEPSFVYRAALDHVRSSYAGAVVYLAPANRFGGSTTEQEAAARYLRARGVGQIVCPDSPRDGYIDTRGNARVLREFLEQRGDWPLDPVVLVAAKRHARRAKLCFRKEGYRLRDIQSVAYQVPTNERLVSRLWYYRYPLCHEIYESLAYVRDALRPGVAMAAAGDRS